VLGIMFTVKTNKRILLQLKLYR